MILVDFTHPAKVPALHLEHDRRSPGYYLRLDELPPEHPFFSLDWALFRYPEWLEGGSAWMQAQAIAKVVEDMALTLDVAGELRPVVGSDDPGFDEALAQSLRLFGLRPMVAEISPRVLTHTPALDEESL